MKVESTRFGTLEVSEEAIIRFEQGLLGFEGYRQYALIRHDPASPFSFLQSLDDPDLTFVVVDPLWLRPDYKVRVREADLAKIDLQPDDDLAVFAIVTVPKDAQEMTANLMAPLLINGRTRQAVQHVQSDGPYQIRHRIRDELARRERLQQAAREAAEAGAQPEQEEAPAPSPVGRNLLELQQEEPLQQVG